MSGRKIDIAWICHEVAGGENMEVRLIAGGLRQRGFEVAVVPARFRSDTVRAIREAVRLRPAVLAFHIQYPASSLLELSLARCARDIGYAGFIVCAGPMVTLQPDWVLERVPAVDGCVRFDATLPLAELIRALRRGGPLHRVPALVTRERSSPLRAMPGSVCWRRGPTATSCACPSPRPTWPSCSAPPSASSARAG